jgi:biotin transporter BioY
MDKALKQWERLWREYYNISASLTAMHRIAAAVYIFNFHLYRHRIFLPLPFTPIPVTGQVFTVLLCGILLGKIQGR